jgi:hypothetical protein
VWREPGPDGGYGQRSDVLTFSVLESSVFDLSADRPSWVASPAAALCWRRIHPDRRPKVLGVAGRARRMRGRFSDLRHSNRDRFMGQSHPWGQRRVEQVRIDLRQCGTINNACPGYVATDLNGFSGTQTPEQGAAIAVRLATLPDDGPRGQLFDDNGPVPW